MTENNDSPRISREIRTNQIIRRDYCKTCNLYMDLDRENTTEEMTDCYICYTGLKRGEDMEYILNKYKMEAI